MKPGDNIKVMVSDRDGVWLNASVEVVNKYNRPGVVSVDEGVPIPFGVLNGKQILCVFDKDDGKFIDVFEPSRFIKFQ